MVATNQVGGGPNLPIFLPQIIGQQPHDPLDLQLKPSPGGVGRLEGSWIAAELEVVVRAGEVQQELLICAPPEDYQPSSLSELVRSTPMDLIRQVVDDLDKRPRDTHNNKDIEPLPKELEWYQQAPLRSDVLYTMVRQVVHIELERFARRVEEYFILTPKQ